MTAPELTHAEIMALSPDELRLRVAIDIFGWGWLYDNYKFGDRPNGTNIFCAPEHYWWRDKYPVGYVDGAIDFKYPTPNYPADIAAAWLVVEKIVHNEGWEWFEFQVVPMQFKTRYRANFTANTEDECGADTAPMAICRAALLAAQKEQ